MAVPKNGAREAGRATRLPWRPTRWDGADSGFPGAAGRTSLDSDVSTPDARRGGGAGRGSSATLAAGNRSMPLSPPDSEHAVPGTSARPGRRRDGSAPRGARGGRALRGRAALLSVLGLAAAAALTAPRPLASQTLKGKVVQSGSREPISGALVRLLDRAEEEAGASFTNQDGRFTVRPEAAGTYRLKVERIGYESWRSEPMALGAGETREEVFSVPVRPVALDELTVTGRRRCRLDPGEATVLTRLWTEIRKALDRLRRTDVEEKARFQLRTFRRILDRDLQVLREETDTGTRTGRKTFRSIPSERLAREGYVQEREDGVHFFAPDAEVLLSDTFQETHCFRTVEPGTEEGETGDPASEDLVGLAFEPASDRRLPDVEGVLWVDRRSATFRRLEFHYTNLDRSFPEGAARGRVEFEPLSTGEWIVRRWWIRWPREVETMAPDARLPDYKGVQGGRHDEVVLSWLERGGELVEVESEAPRRAARGGSVVGSVYDSVHDEPLVGAPVRLVGTNSTDTTDARGRFALRNVPPGVYELVYRHPTVPGLGAQATGGHVTVDPGSYVPVSLAVPSPGRLRDLLCRRPEADVATPDGPGAVAGQVRRPGRGAPSPGAPVVLGWTEPGDAGGRRDGAEVRHETRADDGGHFLVCGLPVDRPVTVRAGDGPERRLELTPDRPATTLVLTAGASDRRGGQAGAGPGAP